MSLTLCPAAYLLWGTGTVKQRGLSFLPRLAGQDVSHSGSCMYSPTGQQRVCYGTFLSPPLEISNSELSSRLSPTALNVSAVTCHRPQEGDSSKHPQTPTPPLWPCTPL